MMNSEEFLKSLGLRIMLLRKRQDLTQADLAAKIDAGLAQVGRIERGEANFSISLLVKMAEVFGMSVAELTKVE